MSSTAKMSVGFSHATVQPSRSSPLRNRQWHLGEHRSEQGVLILLCTCRLSLLSLPGRPDTDMDITSTVAAH